MFVPPRPLYVQIPEEAEGSQALHWTGDREGSALDIAGPAQAGHRSSQGSGQRRQLTSGAAGRPGCQPIPPAGREAPNFQIRSAHFQRVLICEGGTREGVFWQPILHTEH